MCVSVLDPGESSVWAVRCSAAMEGESDADLEGRRVRVSWWRALAVYSDAGVECALSMPLWLWWSLPAVVDVLAAVDVLATPIW